MILTYLNILALFGIKLHHAQMCFNPVYTCASLVCYKCSRYFWSFGFVPGSRKYESAVRNSSGWDGVSEIVWYISPISISWSTSVIMLTESKLLQYGFTKNHKVTPLFLLPICILFDKYQLFCFHFHNLGFWNYRWNSLANLQGGTLG